MEKQIQANVVFTDDAYLKIRYLPREDGGYTIRVGRGGRRDVLACKELYGKAEIGQDIQARVTKVHEDGKLNLSIREKAYLQIGKDAEEVMKVIDSYDGVLPFNDKVSPEIIKRETGMSKNEFKRAVGNLLKAGRIEITEKVIRRIK